MPLLPVATGDGFRNVAISPAGTIVAAEIVGDTLTLVAGSNVTLSANENQDSVTISCGTAYGDVFINAENTNASRYMVFVQGTSGAQSTYIDTDLTYNPSTNVLNALYYSGDGGSLTNLTAGNLSGTIPSAVLGNSTVYIGTTGILLNRPSGSQTLTGVGIDGNAATATKSTNLIGGNNSTLLGSIPYQSNTDTTALLNPNTTSTKKYLTMTGTGANGAAPAWDTIAAGDVPTLNQNTTGTAAGLSGTQTANTFYAGPTTGGAATATFRSIVAGDIPTLNQNTTGSAASLSISGQTGLLTFTGLTSTNRAKTIRDAADTILELGGSYSPTGTFSGFIQGNASTTTDTDATVDASTTTYFAYVQSTSGTARTINISNLTAGRMVRLYLRNTNAATKDITIAASTTASTFINVNLAGSFVGVTAVGQNSGATITLDANFGTALVTVFNANGVIGGGVI
jgi:hypothetical protein